MYISIILAFGIIVTLQAFGDIISAKTNGKLPSIFVSAILFLIGFWTVIPTEVTTAAGQQTTILDISGISSSLFVLLLTLLVTNMGSLMTIKELLAQWRTVLIGIAALGGVMVFAYFVGGSIFGREVGLVTAPPLAGGLAAMSIMVTEANELGRSDLALISALVFATQGLLGYPIMTYVLRRRAGAILGDYKAGKIKLLEQSEPAADAAKSRFKFIPEFPAKYLTPPVLIAKVAIVGILADAASKLTGGMVHTYVLCLVFGIIASEIGFLDKKILGKSETMGLMMVLLMGFVFGGLADASIETMSMVFAPLVLTMIIGVAGLIVFSVIAGKILKENWAMSIAIGINCLCGFPPNYILTNEAAQAISSSKEEYEVLMQEMLPKVLVGGFATVTVGSVIVANIFVGLM